jgi:uncharacterized membrane protein
MGRREVVGDHLLTSSCFSKSYCMLAEDGEYFYVQCILIMAKVHFNIIMDLVSLLGTYVNFINVKQN